METKIIFALLLLAFFLPHAKAQNEFEMKEGDTTYIMKKYYVCFLKKGDACGQDSATTAEIQKKHMENINRLAKMGVILVAGPFEGSGELRGIFIMDCKSLEEAEEYAKTDPAVIAGRLKIEIIPWWTAKGTVIK
jgi:uncharacterized protein